MKRRKLSGSMTVEMSFLMPMILFLIMGCILAVFYYHDKNILGAAAYETAVVGSTKAREKDGVETGKLQALYRVAVRKCAAVTEPERKIREKKKLEELANGAKNNN